MRLYRATEPSTKLDNALAKLLPQLSSSAQMPTAEQLEKMLADNNTHLIIAEIDEVIVGILSLVIVNIPTGRKAWIEDVVVGNEFRGQKIGFKLVEFAEKSAHELGVKKIYLTSNPSRQAAHKLYKNCGFEEYNTCVFRKIL